MIRFFNKEKPLDNKTLEEQELLLAARSLCSLDPKDEGMDAMTDIEVKKVELDCRRILEFKVLNTVIDDLKVRQRNLIAGQATKENLDFARGVLNGINLVKERLRILAERSKERGNGDFNRFEAI
jgi:hypothetical protein